MTDFLVIFRRCDCLCVTPESNYNSFMWNERLITDCRDFKTPDEIIDYYVKYGWATKDEFLIKV